VKKIKCKGVILNKKKRPKITFSPIKEKEEKRKNSAG
jgi:hypothetical protein